MKAKIENVLQLANDFQAELDARLIKRADGGKLMMGTALLKAEAFGAFADAAASQLENGEEIAFSPPQLAAAWEAVLKINESAYSQGFFRRHPGLKEEKGSRAKGIALSYTGE
jgi:hypothetical protein